MQSEPHPIQVLSFYERIFWHGQVEPLGGAGGFSGARFWKVRLPEVGPPTRYCLRCWPREHPSRERLAMQHAVLARAYEAGISFVPVPLKTVQGKTWVAHGGHLWELTPWLPGVADFLPEKMTAKLAAAMTALAQFHSAVADFPGGNPSAIAPSAQQRLQIVNDMAMVLPKLATAIAVAKSSDPVAEVANDILAGFSALQLRIRQELIHATTLPTRLQPAIRDVHRDHILFEGQTVTGLIDFGAMRIDSPAVDIARLLGSMAGDDDAAWQTGLNAYQTVRPLDATELELVGIFDRSTTTMAGMNWLRWLYLEARRFDDVSAIIARLEETSQRMQHLIMWDGFVIRP